MKSFLNLSLSASHFKPAILILSLFGAFLFSCETSGNGGDDPLPEDPIEEINPNIAVALEQIVVSKIGNAVRLRVFPETGSNLEFLTGIGDFTVKATLDLEDLKTPDRTSSNGNFSSFKNERTDTLWISKNDKLYLTLITKDGVTKGGAPRGISFVDVPSIQRVMEESLFAY